MQVENVVAATQVLRCLFIGKLRHHRNLNKGSWTVSDSLQGLSDSHVLITASSPDVDPESEEIILVYVCT